MWKHIAEDRSCPVNEMVVSFSSLASIEPADVEVWANPSRDATPAIHFPPLDGPMARMTENTNLQRALLRRIDEVGKDIVTIREGGRVGEMRLAEGGRWVGLRIGESEWVRGSVVVRPVKKPRWCYDADGRSGQTDRIIRCGTSQASSLMATGTTRTA